MLKAQVDRWSAHGVAADDDAEMGLGGVVEQQGEGGIIASTMEGEGLGVEQQGEGAIAVRMEEEGGEGLGVVVVDDVDMGSGGEFGKEEEEEGVVFPGLVRQLVEVGEEGCFRLVVSFL